MDGAQIPDSTHCQPIEMNGTKLSSEPGLCSSIIPSSPSQELHQAMDYISEPINGAVANATTDRNGSSDPEAVVACTVNGEMASVNSNEAAEPVEGNLLHSSQKIVDTDNSCSHDYSSDKVEQCDMSDNANLQHSNSKCLESEQHANGDSIDSNAGGECKQNVQKIHEGSQPSEDVPTNNFHSRRLRKRSFPRDEQVCCPICRMGLRPSELSTHLWVETEKLNKITKYGRKGKDGSSKKSAHTTDACSDVRPSTSNSSSSQPSAYDTYLQVKSSRQARLLNQSRARKQEVTCPVCNQRMSGSQDELTAHVEQCLGKEGMNEDEDVEVDVEYEEYEWAGQTRIRATTMLQGGLAASGFQVAKKQEDDEEDEDLVVDDEDADVYGPPQYSEADIIPCTDDEPEEEMQRKALRVAYMRGEEINQKPVPSDRTRWESIGSDDAGEGTSTSSDTKVNRATSASSQEIINSLKVRVREMEEQLHKHERPKCLICMEPYIKPVTSTQCWHVHCEECWLRTLGAKKLCPQCNMITSPGDLRRIYF